MWKAFFDSDYWEGVIVGMAIRYFATRKKSPAASTGICPTVEDAVVTSALKPIRQQYDLPAMAAAVVTSRGLRSAGAVGVRKRGTDISRGDRGSMAPRLEHQGDDRRANRPSGRA